MLLQDYFFKKFIKLLKEILLCLLVHIADNVDRDDPDYLLALEKETAILQKRIEACKSRIMIVTCFDVTS